jgi:ABC-2 type transport system permease protein
MRFFYDMYHVFRRDLKSYWRWKLHILFDTIVPIVDIALFLLVWSVIIGGGFEGVGMLNKDNYIAYLFSGFILWNFVNTPFTHDFVHSFIREKHWKTIEYIFISPLKKFSLPYGISILPLLRSIYSTIILLIIGFLFFGFSIKGDFLSIVLIVLLTFLGFSGVGLMISALASWREDFADVSWLINYILSIASGVYFPLEALPTNIKNFLMLLPSTKAVYAVRAIILQGVGIMELLPTILGLIVFGIISIFLAILVYRFVERKVMLIGI